VHHLDYQVFLEVLAVHFFLEGQLVLLALVHHFYYNIF
jgi:hypothetical protein